MEVIICGAFCVWHIFRFLGGYRAPVIQRADAVALFECVCKGAYVFITGFFTDLIEFTVRVGQQFFCFCQPDTGKVCFVIGAGFVFEDMAKIVGADPADLCKGSYG